ncbi:MAG: hypothetical protein UY94_C0005G0019, partial [Parcubacteria group bacterium GW2011_GWA2_56_21]
MKAPCEFCNNIQYREGVYRGGHLFCSDICRTLWREEQERRAQ